MKVSLVATVRDARPHVGEFLASVAGQTRAPDEVVVVDGGSTDGTFEVLQRAPGIVAILEPGANIARGRNVAVRAATHEVIAVSDADCVLAPAWLERLVEPLERGADVAAGFYEPIATSPFQVWAAAHIPLAHEVRPGWMPSSRSLAFRREAFEAAGGYPEWLDVGEDMYLNRRLLETGARMELVPDAVTYWRVRPTAAATWHQYRRYAEGDALGGMYPERHLARFAAYGLFLAGLAARNRVALGAAAAAAAARAARPVRRTWRRLPPGSPARWASLAGVPAVMAFLDAAKMWGYLNGLARRARRPVTGRAAGRRSPPGSGGRPRGAGPGPRTPPATGRGR